MMRSSPTRRRAAAVPSYASPTYSSYLSSRPDSIRGRGRARRGSRGRQPSQLPVAGRRVSRRTRGSRGTSTHDVASPALQWRAGRQLLSRSRLISANSPASIESAEEPATDTGPSSSTTSSSSRASRRGYYDHYDPRPRAGTEDEPPADDPPSQQEEASRRAASSASTLAHKMSIDRPISWARSCGIMSVNDKKNKLATPLSTLELSHVNEALYKVQMRIEGIATGRFKLRPRNWKNWVRPAPLRRALELNSDNWLARSGLALDDLADVAYRVAESFPAVRLGRDSQVRAARSIREFTTAMGSAAQERIGDSPADGDGEGDDRGEWGKAEFYIVFCRGIAHFTLRELDNAERDFTVAMQGVSIARFERAKTRLQMGRLREAKADVEALMRRRSMRREAAQEARLAQFGQETSRRRGGVGGSRIGMQQALLKQIEDVMRMPGGEYNARRRYEQELANRLLEPFDRDPRNVDLNMTHHRSASDDAVVRLPSLFGRPPSFGAPVESEATVKRLVSLLKDATTRRKECEGPEECSICLDLLSRYTPVLLVCGHVFHRVCLRKWMRQKKKTCPLCRKAIRKAPDA